MKSSLSYVMSPQEPDTSAAIVDGVFLNWQDKFEARYRDAPSPFLVVISPLVQVTSMQFACIISEKCKKKSLLQQLPMLVYQFEPCGRDYL